MAVLIASLVSGVVGALGNPNAPPTTARFETEVYSTKPPSVWCLCRTTLPLINRATLRSCTVVITKSTMPPPPNKFSESAHWLNCSRITATNRLASKKIATTTNVKQ